MASLTAACAPTRYLPFRCRTLCWPMTATPRVVECVRNRLLTPYGLRTLAPDAPAYVGRYGGTAHSRDAAYHQGTVWPWLLGHYADALLQTAWDMDGAVQGLLDTVTPLFCQHLCEAGMGSIRSI